MEFFWVYEGLAVGSQVSFLQDAKVSNAALREKNRKHMIIKAGTIGKIEKNERALLDNIYFYTVGLQDGSSVHYIPEYLINPTLKE